MTEIKELVAKLCDRKEELVWMADSIAGHRYVGKDGVKLVHSETHYRNKAEGINEAIIMTTRVLAK